jgi:hypothetical protein
MTPFCQFKAVPHLISAFLKGNPIPQKPTQDNEWNGTKEKIWSVAEQCWKRDPQSRPSAGGLQDHVASLGGSDDRPPEPKYSRPKANNKVDYSRIFDILYQVGGRSH